MKFLYKPLGIIAGVIAGKIAQSIFTALWSNIDDAKPPEPTAPNAGFSKVIAAKTLEAAITAGVGAAADRASAKAFHHLTGAWPGEDPEPN
jgi:hypothetical protein